VPEQPTYSDPFAPNPDDFDLFTPPSLGLGPGVHRGLIIFCVVALGIAVALWVFSLFRGSGDVDLYLHGPGVDSLAKEALVVLGQQQIGRVVAIEVREGRLTAHMKLNRAAVEGMPGSSEFAIVSLNAWMPGNIGVRVQVPETGGTAMPIRTGAVIRATDSPLPRSIPPGFWLVLGGCVVVMGVASAFTKLLNTWLVVLSALAALAAVLSYLNIQISQ